MSKYCRICRNTGCANHGKDITFIGEGYICDYRPLPSVGDYIRAMTDDELSWYLAKKFADYATALYDGSYTPSDEVVREMALELLRQLQQPHEEGCL